LYRRHGLVILISFLILLPVVLYGSKQAWDSVSNRPADWLPESFEETQQLIWFFNQFGSGDELLMISWAGCALGNRQAERLAAELAGPVERDTKPNEPLFRRVFTGQQVLDDLTSPPLDLSREEALGRLEGWLVGPDHRTTCVLALVSEAGMRDRHAAVNWAYARTQSITGLPSEKIHMAGTTMDGVAIDEISKESLTILTGVSLLICFLVMYFCLRSVRLSAMIFVTAIFSQQLGLALVYYCGAHMDSIMLMMGSLVFVLTVSAAVHMVNYYGDAIRSDGLHGAPARAVSYALVPCGLAAATTALGLGSLAVSRILPISRFGIFSALAVLCSLGVLFLLLPSALQQWPALRWASKLSKTDSRWRPADRWSLLAKLVTRHHLAISVLATVAFLVVGWGVTKISTTVRLHDLFTGEVKIIRDYDWIESNVGPLIPVEVVLRFPKSGDQSLLERLEAVQRVRKEIDQIDEVGVTISAATFAPRIAEGPRRAARQVVQKILLEKALQRHRPDFRALRYLQETDTEQLWRISLRVAAKDKVDYGLFLQRLQECVNPVLEELAEEGIPAVTAEFIGGIPLVDKAQRQLLADLAGSFLLAFLLIAVAMMILLRNVLAGLVSMIPNLLPTALVFGLLGWTEFEIGIGSMMTASVALGIAVDGTLHFVTWFRRSLVRGNSRRDAVCYAYQRCGAAMVQTSLICGLGLLVFSVSRFQPSSQFAWLMVTLLAAALLGDLVLLPAILVGPLGRAFQPRSAAPSPPPPDQSPDQSPLADQLFVDGRKTTAADAPRPTVEWRPR